MKGIIASINISTKKGVKKTPLSQAELKVNHGIIGDAHAGEWHRQISLLDETSIHKMKSIELNPGDFAENITTKGLNLYELPIGTKLQINTSVLEITQIGKECHHGCEIRRIVGDCVMPREGIFSRVLKGGIIKPNDEITIKVGEAN